VGNELSVEHDRPPEERLREVGELGYRGGDVVVVSSSDLQPAGRDADHRPPPVQLWLERVLLGVAADGARRGEHRLEPRDREVRHRVKVGIEREEALSPAKARHLSIPLCVKGCC
jgi:hypothetical protein